MTPAYQHYTNIATIGNNICLRTRDPQTKVPAYFKIPYCPRTFTPSDPADQTDNWSTLDGVPLVEKRHQDLQSYYAYVRSMEQIDRPAFGTISPVYQFIAEHMPIECGIPFDSLRVVFLDIEVRSQGGFASPEDPTQPVTLITAEVWGHSYVWGLGEFVTDNPAVTYTQCASEAHLFRSFLRWWTSDYPDVVTGWNTHQYDIPYLINRITRLHDNNELSLKATVMSPWRSISHRSSLILGREYAIPDIQGIALLDYLELYRKFSLTQRESYRLDAIARAELGEQKVSYDEYGSLDELATQNYSKFVEYNIQDVALVRKLNNKLHHVDLCTHIAYGARSNFLDTFKQVRLWDALMYYALYEKQIAVPSKTSHDKNMKYEGAYVKDPIVGQHQWVVSFDVNSLYPSIMRQWNISPDRHLPVEWLEQQIRQIETMHGIDPSVPVAFTPDQCTPRTWLDVWRLNGDDAPIVHWALKALVAYLKESTIDHTLQTLTDHVDPWPWLRVLSVTLSPNRQAFRVDQPGFLPIILAEMYSERKEAKRLEGEAAKRVQSATTPEERRLAEQEATTFGLKQNTIKVCLNSCYGAIGNEYHRFFDVRQAEAVTTTGQMIIRYVADTLNAYLNTEYGTDQDYTVASDTDSVYLRLANVTTNWPADTIVDQLDVFCETVLQPIIDAAFERIATAFNTPEHVLAMKREVIAEYGVWTAKKRYMLWVHDNEGLRYTTPKLKIKGLEVVQSSTPSYAREVVKAALVHFIKSNHDEFYDLLDRAETEFMARPFIDIASPRTCNGLDKYPILPSGAFAPKTPIQVRGALVYNRHLEATQLTRRYPTIRDGEKIRFCYLHPQNPLRSTVISAPHTLPTEWNLDQYLDRTTQFEKTVLAPLERVISCAGWPIKRTTTLF